MPLSYRPIRSEDHDFCVAVHHLAMRAYVEPLWGWDPALQDRLVLDVLSLRDATHELALFDGERIGYLSYRDEPSSLFVNELYLHPAHQGRTHGAAILSRLVVQSGGKPLELSVLTTNPRARAFYERHGFVVTERTPERIRMLRQAA